MNPLALQLILCSACIIAGATILITRRGQVVSHLPALLVIVGIVCSASTIVERAVA